MQSNEALKARAQAVFKAPTPEEKMSATAEYKAAQEAARLRMAEQRAARLARQAKLVSGDR